MKTLQNTSLTMLVLALLAMTILSSCGGSRNGDLQIDESAFPSQPGSDTTSVSSTSPTADEAEVLKLLGINQNKEKASEAAAPSVATNVNQEKKKIQGLEDTLNKKDVEIANLRAELTAREKKLNDLQKQAESPSILKSPSTSFLSSGTFKEKYNQALALYNNGNYQQAIGAFNELLALNESNSLVDNCQYWKGESYYGLGDYNQAILEFNKVFMFNDSNKLDDAQLKLGLCYIQLGDKQKARGELEKLLANYPDSEYIERAQRYLSQL